MRVTVLGGGIAGLSTAYELKKAGYEVVLVDECQTAGGASLGNAGLMCPSHYVPLAAPGMILKGLKMLFSKTSAFSIQPQLSTDFMRWGFHFWKSSKSAVVDRHAPVLAALLLKSRKLIPQWQNVLGFELNESGLLMVCESEEALDEEWHIAEGGIEHGIPAEMIDPKLKESDWEWNVKQAIFYPMDGVLEPKSYCDSLKAALLQSGVKVIENAKVTKLHSKGGVVAAEIDISGKKEVTEEGQLVLCCGAHSNQLLKTIGKNCPLQPGRGYSQTLRSPHKTFRYPQILVEGRVAITPFQDSLRVAGTMELGGFDRPQVPQRVEGIHQACQKVFPEWKTLEWGAEIWDGLRPVSPDGLPYIGKLDQVENLWINCGHAMLGLTLGPGSAQMLVEAMSSHIQIPEPFSPNRFA